MFFFCCINVLKVAVCFKKRGVDMCIKTDKNSIYIEQSFKNVQKTPIQNFAILPRLDNTMLQSIEV